MKTISIVFLVIAWGTVVIPLTVLGHGNIKHSGEVEDSFKAIYNDINAAYKAKVEIIFKGKCFDCHSDYTVYPWYYKVPGVNILIDSDIKEAKSHLDISKGFPFKGHSSPREDLDAIEKSVKSNSMPPLYYRLFHGGSSLTEAEISTILEWLHAAKVQIDGKI